MSPPARAAESRPDVPPRDRPGRPRFLDLREISFPPGALASIAHRVTGLLLALVVPFAALAFARSLDGAEGFADVAQWLASWPARLALVALAAALAYHLLAGLRHLLMDAGIGSSLRAGRATARAVLAAGIVALVAAAACWLP